MDGYCRGCLTKYSDLSQLVQYSEKIRRLYTYSTGLQVKPNDPLFQLCKHCLIKMKLACKFKKECRTSDKKFSHFLTTIESGEVADFDMFLTTHNDSFPLKFPITGCSTPSFQKPTEDDNESTCTSIRNFMTDILRAEDLPDTEAKIIQEMIEKEAAVLDDSLDSHWLADDASIATDFHFSPFSTPSKNNLPEANYSPIKVESNKDEEEYQHIIDQESFIAAKQLLLKTPNPIENHQNVGVKRNLDLMLTGEKEITISVKTEKHNSEKQDKHTGKQNDHTGKHITNNNEQVERNNGKRFYVELDELNANCETPKSIDRIDKNLEEALKNTSNTEFPLDSLLAIATPSVKSGVAGAATPLIDDILFGSKDNEETDQTKKHVYCIKSENIDMSSEGDPLEDFFNKDTGEYVGEIKKEQPEIFDNFIAPQDNTCKICKKQFRNMKSLCIHDKLHHNTSLDSPSKAGKDFSKPGQSKYDLSDFSCQMCDKKFKGVRALKIHFSMIHKIKIETPKKAEERIERFCDRCGKTFHRRSNLRAHIKAMHKKKKNTLICNQCGLEYKSAAKLRMHQNTHSRTQGVQKMRKDEPAVCPICGHVSSKETNLKLHIQRKHTKQYVAECDTCSRKYYRKCDLIAHLRTHTKEKPFQCWVCKKSFGRRDTLNNHIKLHTDEKPHVCEYCNTKFSRRHLLNLHIRTGIRCLEKRMDNKGSQNENNFVVLETTKLPRMNTIEELLELSPKTPNKTKDVQTKNPKDVELPDFKDAANLYDELAEIVL